MITQNSHFFEYIVGGGAAVNHYGFNRPSGISSFDDQLKTDLVFGCNPTLVNYEKLIDALDELEVDTNNLKLCPSIQTKLSQKHLTKIFTRIFCRLWLALESFRKCQDRADSEGIGGVILHLLPYDDVLAYKRVWQYKILPHEHIQDSDRRFSSYIDLPIGPD